MTRHVLWFLGAKVDDAFADQLGHRKAAPISVIEPSSDVTVECSGSQRRRAHQLSDLVDV